MLAGAMLLCLADFGAVMTVPVNAAGSMRVIRRVSATTDAYSVPCAPATSASVGPDFAPFTTITGMSVAASTPAGTWMCPVALRPGDAVAVPTVISAA